MVEVSLRDKIGQMLIIGFEGKSIEADSYVARAIVEDNVGGVVLFDYNYRTKAFDKNIESPEQTRRLTSQLKHLSHVANQSRYRPALPLFICVDYEGGEVNRLKQSYGFPQTITAALAGKMPIAEVEKVAEGMALTLKNAGFNLNFAPVLDVNLNPNNPIIGKLDRSFSADPAKVAQYAALYARCFWHHGIQYVYKHFPGHGSSSADSHLGFVDVTQAWDMRELEPFERLFQQQEDLGMVMTAHIVNYNLDDSGVPATLSQKVLGGILRKRLQFRGVIIADDMQMKAISDHYGLEQSLILAINAGVDAFIFGNQLCDEPQDLSQVIEIVLANVKNGKIAAACIDQSYERITSLKQSLNLQASRHCNQVLA